MLKTQLNFLYGLRLPSLVLIFAFMLQACGGGSDAPIDDSSAQAAFSIEDSHLVEGDLGVSEVIFSVTLTGGNVGESAAVDFQSIESTALEGVDYIATAGTLVFLPGESRHTISIDLVGDLIDESDESFFVVLSNPQSAIISSAEAEGVIVDDDLAPQLSIADASIIEGDSGSVNLSFSVELSAASGQIVELNYTTTAGTATPGLDYTAISGLLSFPAGVTQQFVEVSILADLLNEGDEVLYVDLSDPINATIVDAQGEGFIFDNEGRPNISISDALLIEGDNGSINLSFSAILSATSAREISVNYATSNGSAFFGSDYTATNGTLTFLAGETEKTINVPVIGDTLDESNEAFTVTLSDPVNVNLLDGIATGGITDNDAPPTISVNDANLSEGDTGSVNLAFTVALSAVSGQEISVDYATSNGSALFGSDYTATNGTLTFLAGETEKTINVPVIGDTLDESNEAFTVTLSDPVNVNLLDGIATGGITDNDAPPTISINDASLSEGDTGSANLSFDVELSTASGLEISVDYATSNGSAESGSDYTVVSGTLIYSPGETSRTVSVSILGDTLTEGNELFYLDLSVPNNATINDAQGQGTILDNETATQAGLDQRPNNTTCIAPARPSVNATISATSVFSSLPGFSFPLAMHQPPGDDTQWFVIEKAGIVKAFDNNPTVSTVRTVLDITSIVDNGPSEAGLLGMAFHPDFQVNGEVFLSYTRTGSPLVSYISRFTSIDSGQTLDPASEEVILTVDQDFDNHNGGHLAFSDDGLLYIGFGDGGGGGDPNNRSQDTTRLLGSILRIDVDGAAPYVIPADNPFAGNPTCSTGTGSSACPETYAWGLRNPWRWSFDRGTGGLWLSDVGQNAWEEVNVIERGGNYGWRIREGAHCYNPSSGCQTSGLIDPVAEYGRSQGASITGGYVYRGTAIPELIGAYLFGDFVSGRIWALQDDGQGGYLMDELLDTDLNIASFAEGSDGEIYIVDYWSRLRQLTRSSGGGVDTIPTLLSDTGCVDSVDPRLPASGMIPFDTNVALWADGAEKQRWLGLPNGETISINAEDDWVFPNGTVLLKHFILNSKFIETRLLMRHTDGSWAGYTYEWDDAETEATRVRGGKSKVIDSVNWVYPSESQCMMCHTVAAGFSLGPETGQLNKDFTYPSTGRTDNQLHTLDSIIAFDLPLPDLPDNLVNYPDPFDTAEALANRARAYLRTHCSQCHRPGGPTPSSMDLRYQTSFAATNTCNAIPSGGDLGISGARLIVPGDASRSIIPNRMTRRDVHGMPPLGTSIIDTAGVAVISDWINSLSSCP